MNIWEFRKLVRQRRKALNVCCPLGLVFPSGAPNPSPAWAASCLDMDREYSVGVAAGFDRTADTGNPWWQKRAAVGIRYGKRMRAIAERKYRNGTSI